MKDTLLVDFLTPSMLIGILTLLGWLFYSYFFLVLKVEKSKGFSSINYLIYEYIPQGFTTIGIFGTFLGIFFGLQDFNVKSIDESIPNLLNGLKTAFVTSLLGLILSFIFSKIIKGQIKKYSSDTGKELPDIISNNNTLLKNNNEILSELKEIIKNSIDQSNNTLKNIDKSLEQINLSKLIIIENHLVNIENRISNDLIINNIEVIKQNIVNQHKDVIDKINEISKIIAESNTKALVEVMKQATEEFNKQMSALIQRLVQENFEQLNQSVERMNTWQQENKEMITLLTNQFKQVSKEFAITSQSISQIVENTKILTNENSILKKLIDELRKVMIEDKKFESIVNGIDYSVEILKNTINELSDNTTQLSKWTDSQRIFTENVNNLIVKLNDVKNVKDINEIFWKNLENQLNNAVLIVKEANNQLNNNLSTLDDDFRRRLNETLNSLDSLIKRIILNYDQKLN